MVVNMAKSVKKRIDFNAKDLKIGELLDQGVNAPLVQRVAAVVVLKGTIKKVQEDLNYLKECYDKIADGIITTEYEKNINNLKAVGLLNKTTWIEEKPEFHIIDKEGKESIVTMRKGTDDQFEIDAGLAAKSTLDVIPDRYKKVSTVLDRAAIKGDFMSGALPKTMERFCSKDPISITKMTIKAVGEKEEEEDD